MGAYYARTARQTALGGQRSIPRAVPRVGTATGQATSAQINPVLASGGALHYYQMGDIQQADLTDVASAPARVGSAAVQATPAKQPEYVTTAWPYGGAALRADDVGEAVIAPSDFSGTDKVTVFVVCSGASGMTPVKLRVVAEYGRYYAGAGGWSVFMSPSDERVYFGAGVAAAYQDASWTSVGSGTRVYAFTMDAALAAPAQIRGWIDGVSTAPDSTGVGTGMVGTFPSASLYIGARDNGAGGLERPANRLVRSLLAFPAILSDADIEATCESLGLLARIS